MHYIISVLQVLVWDGHYVPKSSVAKLLVSLRNRYGMGIWSESSIPIRTTDGHIPAKIETLKASDVYKSFMRLKRPGKACDRLHLQVLAWFQACRMMWDVEAT